MRINLHDGMVADWECNGNRVTIYGPMSAGYRERLIWADLVEWQPGWSSQRAMQWELYRDTVTGRPRLLDSHMLFDSVDGLIAWIITHLG